MEQYGETLFTTDIQEIRRLELLSKIFDPFSMNRLRTFISSNSCNCLEVGIGSGSIARWLCTQVKDGSVTATDISVELLDSLNKCNEPNLTVVHHDVTLDPFQDGSFDLIHARFVLSHLRNKDEVISRMVKWLRPGGWLMIESFAWFPIDSSPNKIYRRSMNAWEDLIQRKIGTDARWARSYPIQFIKHNLSSVGSDVFVPQMQGGTPLADFWRFTLKMSELSLIKEGYLQLGEFEEAMSLFSDPVFWDLAPAVMQGWGQRSLQPREKGTESDSLLT